MSIKNHIITENLKNWYFIDSVLLNGYAKKVIKDSKQYNEFITLKAALLNNLNEFYKYIGYVPNNKIPDTEKVLKEQAVADAKKTKLVAAKMIQSESFKKHMKKIVLSEFKKTPDKSHIDVISEKVIKTRFSKICLDNILVGVPMIKCKNPDRTTDFKAQMLEQAYLLIRSDLIKIAEKYELKSKKV